MPDTNRKKNYTGETRPKSRVPVIKRQELEDNDGWTHMAFELVVEHSIHCYWNIYDDISKRPRPAVLISNHLEEVGQHDLNNKIPEEPSKRLQAMPKYHHMAKARST